MNEIAERDAVLRERAAFVAGANFRDLYCPCSELRVTGAEAEAKARFVLPKVSRPRVVKDGYGRRWKLIDVGSQKELRFSEGGDIAWRNPIDQRWLMDSRVIAAWADLWANPTELVDEDVSHG